VDGRKKKKEERRECVERNVEKDGWGERREEGDVEAGGGGDGGLGRGVGVLG